VVEAFEVLGAPGLLRDRFRLGWGHHAFVDLVPIRVQRRVLLRHRRDVRLQLLRTRATSVVEVDGNHLARLGIHGDPAPWLVGFLPDAAPPLNGLL